MICSAWIGHTPRSKALAECIEGARIALGWKHEDLAQRMGLSRADLSHMLAGRKPLNLFRLGNLGDDFDREYDKRKAGLRGAVVLEPPDLSFIRGACAIGERQMVAFTTPHKQTVTLPLQQKASGE